MTAQVLRLGRVVMLAAAIVAGCGGPAPTPSTPSAALGSVCDLVAGMDELVGRTVVAKPSSYTVGSSERCLWVYVSDPSRYVGVTVGPATSHVATIDSFGEGDVVDGVGEDTRWWEANRTISTIAGDRSLQVDLQIDDLSDPRALAVSIAEVALDQLR